VPALRSVAAAVVTEFNRRMLQMNEPGLFLTMAFGILDLREGAAALVHAGHPPCLLSPGAGAAFRPVGEAGVPVGILEAPAYEASLVALPAGARLALYSDGITDCRDAHDVAFGEERLRRRLQDEAAAPLAQSCARLRSDLRGWRGGEFEDDVTLLALEVR
jgi:sigma-B regulation protein RsbU (phosphoserine phosphatase)